MSEAIRTGRPLPPMERHTVPEIFLHGLTYGSGAALMHRSGGEWRGISHAEVERQVGQLAALLEELGVGRGDRVALLSENRPEWQMADFAVLSLGAADVPIYPTLPAEQVRYILADSGARVALVSTAEQLDKVQEVRGALPALEQVICFDGEKGPGVLAWAEALRRGQARLEAGGVEPLRERAGRVEPDDLATLIYTSGTTGNPKGVMLSHRNLAYMVAATRAHGTLPVEPGGIALSFLPLSHVLERAADCYFWDSGVTIAYAESVAQVPENLLQLRPHYMVSVPRLYEKIYARVSGAEGVKGRLARWAIGVAGRVADPLAEGRSLAAADRLQLALADRLVFSKLRQRTGGRIRTMIAGGAPLAADIARLFYAARLPVYEGYGLTETSPVLAANRPSGVRFGTVGEPYPGVEVRIGAENEILARTPGLMRGYWGLPEKTAEVIDADGWFHTGDVGEIDADGFLRITDRLKDLIVTAGGKNIAPQPIENQVALSPYIAQAVMIGDRRPYPVLLLVPDLESLRGWAAEHPISVPEGRSLLDAPEVRALLEGEAQRALTGLARHETPKKVGILPEELSQDAGTLTPTLKVRRRAVEERYRDLIEGLYGE